MEHHINFFHLFLLNHQKSGIEKEIKRCYCSYHNILHEDETMKKLIMSMLFAVIAASVFCAEKDAADLKVPWLSIYYVRPQVTVEDEVKIGFYVTDWYQSEYRLGDDSCRFHASLKIWKKDGPEANAQKWSLKDLKAGDHEFNAGKFASGEYIVALTVEDTQGRKGPVLFHEFRVAEDFSIPEKEIYRMTEADLKKYEISNKGDYGIFHFFDAKGKNEKTTAAMTAEEAQKVKVPSGKYVVVAGAEKYNPEENRNHRGVRNAPLPEWLPNSWGWRTCKVLYADDYDKAKVEAESVTTGKGLNKFLADMRKAGYRKVIMLPGTYRISNTTPVSIPSGLTWDLNGCTIKMNQFAGHQGRIIRIRDGVDTHLVNGIVEGDYFEHDYKNSKHMAEWVLGIDMDGASKYSSVERVLLRYITGYGIHHGFHGEYGNTPPISSFKPGTIDEATGRELPDAEGLAICDFMNAVPLRDKAGYLTISRWLGYQGMTGDDWSCRYHFYDKDGNYLETIRGRQYRRVRIPEKAASLRVTVYASVLKDANSGGLRINLPRLPWNCWYQDIFILSARAVGMVPSAMYNFRVENCSFARSGENLARCAFDAEDGWDMMQDVWIVRNKFFKNPYNELLTCVGHNFVIEDNEGHIHNWGRNNGYTVRNNVCRGGSAFHANANRADTGLVRIYNNTYQGSVQLGSHGFSGPDKVNEALKAVDPDQWMTKEEKAKKAEQEKQASAKTYWFIVMQDIDKVPELKFGTNAALYKQTIRNKKLGRIVAVQSTVEDCKNMLLNWSDFSYSKVKNFSGYVNNNTSVSFSNSELENGEVSIHAGGTATVRNCHLKNTVFAPAHWHVIPRRLVFENCTFEYTDKPVVRTPVFGIEEFKFINCKFNTGKAPVIEVMSMNKNKDMFKETDKKSGAILFENCTIANQNGSVVRITANINSGSRKKITVTAPGSKYGGLKLVSADVPWWQIGEAAEAAENKLKTE